MLTLVILFSLIVVGLSGYGLFVPRGYISLARRFAEGPGIWGGFVIRLGLAILLWLAAPSSATPTAFRALAVLALFGAVALPVIGQERFRKMIEWGAGQPFWILRSLSLLGLIFGLFLLWSSLSGMRAG